MSDYIVASSRSWHRPAFDRFATDTSGSWHFVDTDEALVASLASISPRYIFFLHWSTLVPSDIYEKFECVCFHMTDVPYGRGGSPLQNLIQAGKTDTKVSALRMEKALDAGPVYGKRFLSLDGRAEEIYLRAGDICWEMIEWMVAHEPHPIPQQGEVTIFKRRTPEQSALPAATNLRELFDHIRMLDAPGYPLAFVQHGDFQLEFSHAELIGDELQARVNIRKIRR